MGIYEAVATTTDGTFRCFLISETQVCITEDGVGVTDLVDLTDESQPFSSPEQLTSLLIWYLYERQRGLEILTVTLRVRGRG